MGYRKQQKHGVSFCRAQYAFADPQIEERFYCFGEVDGGVLDPRFSMKPFQNATIAAVFEAYPLKIRRKMMVLREAIFETAKATQGVGDLEETLKWGEPAYLTSETRSGSTVRISWKRSKPSQYAMYFICTTNLVETFRSLFPKEFKYEGNRAIVFEEDGAVPMDSLTLCISAALTYRRSKINKKPVAPAKKASAHE